MTNNLHKISLVVFYLLFSTYSLAEELNINAKSFENIVGKDPDYNAEKIKEIFKGKDNDFSTAVCLNAAAGLIVSNKQENFKSAYEECKNHILSGKAFNHLKLIQNDWKYFR